ncbi:D-(-)-3-hydroxybutyrate oligomer hydrolase [Acidovorax sp. SUPP3334]|uniref:D-(-)-3-hydroxybutyrate oligomer hydrolase n=1 Tax=Acidovorax sp. SUPP3334 TaxID=2920881 RepID=UPI0023DE2304|nr:D-(-)-3-hydroxybutyrate oligomer hydrolase [Acidovorax sp. SUPP3334]GKT21126.1 D-(-)-3-hydroxybutyrate oligomer hydrolase [Acidovorax sp. SUPP3334]
MRPIIPRAIALAALTAALLAACGGGGGNTVDFDFNVRPSYLASVRQATYDGVDDDLLTAGLGRTGLADPDAPGYEGSQPTAAEMRRNAIYTNYRALLDMTAAGGYGTLYGPNVDAQGRVTVGEGKIAGTETIAYYDDGSGRQNVTLMVQVPDTFNPARPCIITATASGSRGIYGGMSTGEWGLKRGCAVAYTDKGTGAAPHDLQADTVPLIDGTRASATSAGTSAAFNAGLSAADLAAFNTATPNRFAFKHAHSGQNPEKDWGLATLRAVEMGFYVINERFGDLSPGGQRLRTFKPSNTIVIASSLSNGGAAAIAAAEQDTQGLIGGVAVSEPAVELPANPGVTVRRGNADVAVNSRTLIDYTTYAQLYQACAALAPSISDSPYASTFAIGFASPSLPIASNRCEALRAQGLITGGSTVALAEQALARMRAYGWEAESVAQYPALAGFEVVPAVAVTFANALSRSSVKDNLCGYSFAATTAQGAVTPLAPAALADMFATGNGVPPSAGVQLVNNRSLGGPARDVLSQNAAGVRNWNLEGALCLRNLITGSDDAARRLQAGVDETRRSGNLRGKPAIIVHGRSDALLPVNHTSRPYAALNRRVEGSTSRLRYIEVTNAQHFDSFIGLTGALPGFDSRYIPLHVYMNRALDAMYDHLANGTALPASQVVRTVPRGGTPGSAPAITAANVPAIAATPVSGNAINITSGAIAVPE